MVCGIYQLGWKNGGTVSLYFLSALFQDLWRGFGGRKMSCIVHCDPNTVVGSKLSLVGWPFA